MVGVPKPNPDFPIFSERRSVFFIDWMNVYPQDKNVQLTVLHHIYITPNWNIRKDGFDVFQYDRVTVKENTTTFKCVMSYDSGVYSFIQQDALNTGYNVQSRLFNLTVGGAEDSETLRLVDGDGARLVISGQAFQTQPTVEWGIIEQDDEAVSSGRIEPFIARAPTTSLHHYITFDKIEINSKRRTTTFKGLAITGEPGEYQIGFVDADTCEIVLVSEPIRVVSMWYGIITMCSMSTLVSLFVFVLGLTIRLITASRRTNTKLSNFFKSFNISILINNIDTVLEGRGTESLQNYFKFLRLSIIQSVVLALLGLVLLIPISLAGDNSLFDIYLLTQANWQFDSSRLFVYQVAFLLVFISIIILYSRFNGERVYSQHDSNHLVTSRTVLLKGLPKSLVDCTILNEYLQTSYSKGIFSLSIILEKEYERYAKILDLDGLSETIIQIDGDKIDAPLRSTGQAFVTFSCVSDAHQFQTQYSPHKWSWAKAMAPTPPAKYEVELQIKQWKAYSVPRVSDIMWTKLHSPSNQHSTSFTLFLLALSFLLSMSFSFLAAFIHDSQFGRLSPNIINIQTDPIGITSSSFFIYTFIPCNMLLFLNRVLPCVVKGIFEKSNSFVRSSLKSKIMLTTFYVQTLSIVGVPTIYYSIMTAYPFFTTRNEFFYPSNFFRTGGMFYTLFIIYYAIVTPFLDSSRIYSSIANLIKFSKKKDQALINERFLDISTQYINILLLMLMVSIYAPIFPLLFLMTLIYLIKKYFFDKYTIITSKIKSPPSDRLLVEPLQHCIWFVLTSACLFHLFYVFIIDRSDLLFIYGFLFIIGLGRYIPSCSRSLCYGVCDGAVLPCVDSDIKLFKLFEEGDDSDDETRGNVNNTNEKYSMATRDDDGVVAIEMKDYDNDEDEDDNENGHGNRKLMNSQMTLNIKQNYAVEGGQRGFFSALFSNRYQLPSPKAITINQYTSPLYITELSHYTSLI
ncbi:hypothetical protein PPL_11277 [Heterostelium album PN500]|uniref:CSC1/OSCA1-like 7TM region domain-containing protein n=1 Tax=Heterostelium pallidum (strain ATCC 26659 / Pp 5 / PN500) TaxID=670386 RepID=D3BU17_HETP5|nr:hypothetical protein PPL_11277 [Heterostelium album PN500]EFA75203.1 hypothetical protein PPL_11277 [Heterostelium album PN500]|eukprot:XP_020427337.1 hypothetical protein PPL_11277 [Heterostelium album PN500]